MAGRSKGCQVSKGVDGKIWFGNGKLILPDPNFRSMPDPTREVGLDNFLQTGSVDDLVVNDQLTTTLVDDQSTDAATALGVGVADATVEVTLRDDGETLADVTALGHGDDAAIVTEVEDAVGLVDGTQHGLDDNGGRGVGDEAGLLLQLAGEEVDTQVAVLAGLGGDGDADDLAGTALQDQDVADTDEVAGDGDGVSGRGAGATGFDDTDVLTDTVAEASWTTLVSNNFLVILVVAVVMEGMHDAVGSTPNTAAEGVVVTLVVVVSHLASGVVIDYGLRLVNLKRSSRSRRRLTRGDRLNVQAGGERGAGRRINTLRLESRRRTERRGSFLREGPIVRDVKGLGRLVRVYSGSTLGEGVVRRGRGVCVVGWLGTTTIVSLSQVKLVGKSLIVDRLRLLEG